MYGSVEETPVKNVTDVIEEYKEDEPITNNETVTKKEDNESILVNKEHRDKDPEIKMDTEVKKETEVKKQPEVKKDTEVKKEEKKTSTKKKQNYQTYTVKEGDNLTGIADAYDVNVSDIKDWNDLESDKILSGQKLKIYSDKKVTSSSKKAKTYTIKSGDNLTKIAEDNGVTVANIKEWNNLESDVIQEGQVLKLYADKDTKKETKKKETKSKTTYHTVKKGETLGKLAEKYDVTISDIKKWNKIKGDTIEIGQKLIVKK
jgi:LysM repeat protein